MGMVTLTSGLAESLEDAAALAAPEECCGILFGTGAHITAAIPAKNIHPDPATHFEIDPQTLIDAHRAEREGGAEVAGYYHSHPNGLAQPSETDRRMAAHDGKIWAIVAEGAVSFWRDDPGGFERLSYSAPEV